METEMTESLEEEDEFWKVALLSSEDRAPTQHQAYDEDNDDPESNEESQLDGRLKTFYLPDGITLTVSSLAENEGVMSPLGAHAWHASLLLSAYIITRRDTLIDSINKQEGSHCLELGSGAVGIVGMTLAAVLNDYYRPHLSSVLLTDLASERGILETLQHNVVRNKATVFPRVNVSVQPLDWNDYIDNKTVPSNLTSFDLVVGSELVFTDETAVACAAVVTRLMLDNPNLSVLILQVTDRPGFETHFVPLLEKEFDVCIEQPLDVDLFEMVGSHENAGGTLDRFAYGACWIRRKR